MKSVFYHGAANGIKGEFSTIYNKENNICDIGYGLYVSKSNKMANQIASSGSNPEVYRLEIYTEKLDNYKVTEIDMNKYEDFIALSIILVLNRIEDYKLEDIKHNHLARVNEILNSDMVICKQTDYELCRSVNTFAYGLITLNQLYVEALSEDIQEMAIIKNQSLLEEFHIVKEDYIEDKEFEIELFNIANAINQRVFELKDPSDRWKEDRIIYYTKHWELGREEYLKRYN